MSTNRLDNVKKVIKDNYEDGECGIYFTRNIIGDPMETIYENDGVTIDICYKYEYFEIFGLTEDEEAQIENYYRSLKKRIEEE